LRALRGCQYEAVANMKRLPHTKPIKPGRWQNDLIHSDLQGPFYPTYDGYQYLVTFLDDKTLRSAVFLLRDKSAKSVLDAFRMYANQVEHEKCIITKRLRHRVR
jgi:hypothetical protein